MGPSMSTPSASTASSTTRAQGVRSTDSTCAMKDAPLPADGAGAVMPRTRKPSSTATTQ